MKVPYFVQGTFFSFGLVGLMFLLRLTCPDNAGAGCFADHFITPVFLPSILVSSFSHYSPMLVSWEPLVILVYWGIVGFLVGLCFDIYTEGEQKGN